MTKGSIPSDCVNYIPDFEMRKAIIASHIINDDDMYDSESSAEFSRVKYCVVFSKDQCWMFLDKI